MAFINTYLPLLICEIESERTADLFYHSLIQSHKIKFFATLQLGIPVPSIYFVCLEKIINFIIFINSEICDWLPDVHWEKVSGQPKLLQRMIKQGLDEGISIL